ncbi:MAG: MFS transporter [Isosphaeraceae bacterium]
MHVAPSEPAAETRPSGVRHLVLAGMVGSVVVAYLSRTVLAPAGSVIQRELALTNVEMGTVHGIWAFGYVWFQLPGGWLGDRFGRRVMLPCYGLLWSLCTLWTAVSGGYSGLWWSRLVFGVAQAGLIPCLTRACVDWFPEERRGTASAAITAGMSAGAVAATGLAAWLVPWLGWRLTCRLFALTGLVWAVQFWLVFRDRPERHPRVNPQELALIREGRDDRAGPEVESREARSDTRLGRLSRLGIYGTLAFWLLTGQGVCRTFCYNFLTSWFPTFLERAHGVKLTTAGLMTMLPLAGVAVGSMGGGPIVDALLRRTGSRRISRAGVGTAGMALAGLGSLAAVYASTPAAALLVLAIGSASLGMANPATWAATMDLGGGRSASAVMAIANMAGNLAALLCPIAVGAVLDATGGRWTLVLLMLAAVAFAGALCWIFLDPRPADVRRDR